MPIYQLDKDLWFPPPSEYEEHGIVAVGGDLSVSRLLLAYQNGLFPWYNEGDPITWWCPFKRMVLKPSEIRVSKSSRNLINRGIFQISYDQNFDEVVKHCQDIKRPEQDGTWINDELRESLSKMHELGLAHSVECRMEGELVGGLYGLSLGKFFFGESMFSKRSNASKMAFIHLCKKLESLDFELVDCQIHNDHLASLGAYEMDRGWFLDQLESLKIEETVQGNWGKF